MSLVLERYERGWPFPLPAVDVEILLPHLVALLVVGLHRRGEVAGGDGGAPAVSHGFGCRHKRFSFKQAVAMSWPNLVDAFRLNPTNNESAFTIRGVD